MRSLVGDAMRLVTDIAIVYVRPSSRLELVAWNMGRRRLQITVVETYIPFIVFSSFFFSYRVVILVHNLYIDANIKYCTSPDCSRYTNGLSYLTETSLHIAYLQGCGRSSQSNMPETS